MEKSSWIYSTKNLVVLTIFVFSTAAHALIVTGVSGASSFTINNNAVVNIFGGIAGPRCSDNGLLCNSCNISPKFGCSSVSTGQEQSPLCACNTSRISDEVVLTLSLDYRGPKGNALVMANGYYLPVRTPKNGGKFVDFTWREVCNAMGSSSCEQISLINPIALAIFIDRNGNGVFDSGEDVVQLLLRVVNPGSEQNIFGRPNNEGVGGFIPFPGDQKIYLSDLSTTNSFPNMSYGATITAVRAFVAETSMWDAVPGSASRVEDFHVNSDGTLASSFMDGFDNGKPYFVRLGLVDQANNVVQFFPAMTDLSPACMAMSDANVCPYGVIPSKVRGSDPDLMAKLGVAVATGDLQEVDRLTAQLKDIDEPFNKIGETALTLAALNWHPDVVSLLLRKHAAINHQTKNGYSALMFGAIGPHGVNSSVDATNTIRILLHEGAWKSLQNIDKDTAYDLAIKANHPDLAKLLK